MARPSKWQEEFIRIAAAFAKFGATDREIAEMLSVSERTLNYWKIAHPRLSAALRVGKEAADARVEMALYRRAIGYSYDAVKIVQNRGAAIEHVYVEHVPPDIKACIFWLKNRKPAEWCDRMGHQHTAEDPLASLIMEIASGTSSALRPSPDAATNHAQDIYDD